MFELDLGAWIESSGRRGNGGRELQGKKCPEQKWGEGKAKAKCGQEQTVQLGRKQMLGDLSVWKNPS